MAKKQYAIAISSHNASSKLDGPKGRNNPHLFKPRFDARVVITMEAGQLDYPVRKFKQFEANGALKFIICNRKRKMLCYQLLVHVQGFWGRISVPH